MGVSQVLATKLAVTNGTSQFTAPTPMSGANAFRISVTVLNLGGASGIVLTPQGSTDGTNYHDLTASSSLGLGFNTFQNTAVTDAFVRVMWTTQGTGTVIVAGDIYTSFQ